MKHNAIIAAVALAWLLVAAPHRAAAQDAELSRWATRAWENCTKLKSTEEQLYMRCAALTATAEAGDAVRLRDRAAFMVQSVRSAMDSWQTFDVLGYTAGAYGIADDAQSFKSLRDSVSLILTDVHIRCEYAYGLASSGRFDAAATAVSGLNEDLQQFPPKDIANTRVTLAKTLAALGRYEQARAEVAMLPALADRVSTLGDAARSADDRGDREVAMQLMRQAHERFTQGLADADQRQAVLEVWVTLACDAVELELPEMVAAIEDEAQAAITAAAGGQTAGALLPASQTVCVRIAMLAYAAGKTQDAEEREALVQRLVDEATDAWQLVRDSRTEATRVLAAAGYHLGRLGELPRAETLYALTQEPLTQVLYSVAVVDGAYPRPRKHPGTEPAQ